MQVLRLDTDMIRVTVKDNTFELTQDELDLLLGLFIPLATPKERHIFSLFQRLSPEGMESMGMLLKP